MWVEVLKAFGVTAVAVLVSSAIAAKLFVMFAEHVRSVHEQENRDSKSKPAGV